MTTSDRRFGQELRLGEHTFLVRGHAELLPVPGGVRPVRIPADTWWQLAPGWSTTALLYEEASGVRLVGRTEATALTLRVRCRQRVEGDGFASPASAFALTVDGREVAAVPTPVTSRVHVVPLSDVTSTETLTEDATVVFAGLPAGSKEIEIWLPQAIATDLLDCTTDAPVTASGAPPRPVWVHYGSSISHCAEPDNPLQVWPVVTARRVGLELVNLGLRGSCLLEPFVADVIAATPADVISLKVGINLVGGDAMSVRTFVPCLHGFLDRIRAAQPDVPLVLTSAILWPGNEDLPGPSTPTRRPDGRTVSRAGGSTADLTSGALTLSRSRDLVRHVASLRAQRGENIAYLDGRELYGPGDAAVAPLPDGLHPSAAIYEQMGERFARLVFGSDGLRPAASL